MSKPVKKILLYAADGVGLGHLQRLRLVAEEMKKLKKEQLYFVLATSSPTPDIFGKFYDDLVGLTPLSDELLSTPDQCLIKRLSNGDKLADAFEKFKPDMVVADFYLSSPFTFYPLGRVLKRYPTKTIYIWRVGDRETFIKDFKDEQKKLSFFEKVILPHEKDEIKELLPESIFKKIIDDGKFEICPPIFRTPDENKTKKIKQKYKISKEDFLITVTLGGGGKLEGGECDNPEKIIRNIFKIYDKLIGLIPSVKIIISTGPYFGPRKRYREKENLKIIDFEKDFLELMSLCKLIISPVGYNTANEILVVGRPVIFLPLMRGNREQFTRADRLEKQGNINVCKKNTPDELLNLIKNIKRVECRTLSSSGARDVAQIILNKT